MEQEKIISYLKTFAMNEINTGKPTYVDDPADIEGQEMSRGYNNSSRVHQKVLQIKVLENVQ